MSNTSIVTKLLTLVKGAFGRKDTVSDTVREPRTEDQGQAAENGGGEQKTSTATAERAEEAAPAEQAGEKAAEPAKPEPAKPESAEPAEKTEPEAPAEKADPAEKAAAEQADEEKAPAEKTGQAEEKGSAETPVPATDDVPEKDAAIAQELDTNENHTEVASDDVLERVRKGAAPSAEELAVPTYDELTLPSIRARLRKLTIDQVRDLRAYEVAHQSRPEFIKMYDNRIAKLQAEDK